MNSTWKRLAVVVVAAAVLAAGYVYWKQSEAPAKTAFRTATVQRGDLFVGISATGTVEPEEVIDVGAQIAGQIKSFGKDRKGKPIDYGSEVKAGMVLARIDDSLYQADESRAAADLRQQKALLKRSQADLEQVKAKYRQAKKDWERAKQLGPSDALSATSFDAYQAAYEAA